MPNLIKLTFCSNYIGRFEWHKKFFDCRLNFLPFARFFIPTFLVPLHITEKDPSNDNYFIHCFSLKGITERQFHSSFKAAVSFHVCAALLKTRQVERESFCQFFFVCSPFFSRNPIFLAVKFWAREWEVVNVRNEFFALNEQWFNDQKVDTL